MMKQPGSQHPFKSRSFWHSLGYACRGIQTVFRTERNYRTHIILTVLVGAAGLYFEVTALEWALLLLCISLMLAVESLNTAIEYLVDMLAGGKYSEKAKAVKDIAAGACLTTAIGTALVGAAIFAPYLLAQFEGLSSGPLSF